MTPQAIINRVNEEAHARLNDVVERAFIGLRNHHTHASHRRECNCDYCYFITHGYTAAKIRLHRLNQKLRYIEQWDYWHGEIKSFITEQAHRSCLEEVSALKAQKKELKDQIV